MKPLTKAIRSAHVEGKAWRKYLYKFLLNYRTIPHSTTGFAPSELLFNRNLSSKQASTVNIRACQPVWPRCKDEGE